MKCSLPMLRFQLGNVTATPGADRLLRTQNHSPFWYLARHQCGDWGDVSPDDARANDAVLIDGSRLLSAYTVGDTRLWIITEADRATTTLLLPDEY